MSACLRIYSEQKPKTIQSQCQKNHIFFSSPWHRPFSLALLLFSDLVICHLHMCSWCACCSLNAHSTFPSQGHCATYCLHLECPFSGYYLGNFINAILLMSLTLDTIFKLFNSSPLFLFL
jgi:hypothetical protein